MHGSDAHVECRKLTKCYIRYMLRLNDKSYNSCSTQTYRFQSAKARIITQNDLKWPYI